MGNDRNLGLFPLDLVLLPGETVPLHLFEPRYRQLYADTVLDDVPFVLVRETAAGRAHVGCTARFETLLRRHADGRLDVVVRGGDPVELVRDTDGSLYLSAVVRTLVDLDDAPPPDRRAEIIARYRELAGPAVAVPDAPDVPLSYTLAATLTLDADAKQALLTERSETLRMEMLADAFEAAADRTRFAVEAGRRARTNGKVAHP